jgi:hypothetical protein
MPANIPNNLRGRLMGPAFKRGWFLEQPLKGLGQPEVSREQLHTMLAGAFGEVALRPPEAFDDRIYYLPLLAEARKVFDLRSMATRNAWGEVFDCEDFAYWLRSDFAFHRYCSIGSDIFMPFAAGILWGRLGDAKHALNIVVTSDEGVCLMDSMPGGSKIAPKSDWQVTADYIVI